MSMDLEKLIRLGMPSSSCRRLNICPGCVGEHRYDCPYHKESS